MAFIEFKNVIKQYGEKDNTVYALNGASFSIEQGEFVVIVGPSGAGKSTVLNLLGGMDKASGGEIIVGGQKTHTFTDKQLTDYRAKEIGFIFQFYNLIPNLTVYENIALIKEVAKDFVGVEYALESVGLLDHKNKFPAQLSGGEQQRVSIARAIVKNPSVLLCDEPTGALDSNTGVIILSLLQRMARNGRTVIIVTHNTALEAAADKIIKIKNGKINEVIKNASPLAVEEVSW